jgi:signal transduction histidine kinase
MHENWSVFFNLILNACEASQRVDATITVAARNAGNNFEIRFKDDGPGIPECVRGTLFDPFVSYGKPNGTGLGLAIVSKIVQDHSGTVFIEETSERGTTVLVQLPLPRQSVVPDMKSTFT